MVEYWKVNIYMLDITCVFAANCPKEQGDVLGGGYGKIKTIIGIKERAGFVVEDFVYVEEASTKLMSLIETSPKGKRLFMQ